MPLTLLAEQRTLRQRRLTGWGKTRMSFRWDNIEILRAIDRIQGDTYHGGPIQGMSGLQLMEEVSGKLAADQQVTGGFIQELHIARDLGLLTFRVRGNFGQGEPS